MLQGPAQLQWARMGLLDKASKLSAVRPSPIPPTLPGLDLHDIQFALCEYDKYERLREKLAAKRRYGS